MRPVSHRKQNTGKNFEPSNVAALRKNGNWRHQVKPFALHGKYFTRFCLKATGGKLNVLTIPDCFMTKCQYIIHLQILKLNR